MKEISGWNIKEWWIGGEIECCASMANRWKAAVWWHCELFDLWSIITLTMHWYDSDLLFICRVSLTSSLLSPSLRGCCSCLWSWLWWRWFLSARQFIDLPRVNLPGWETICGWWHGPCVHLRTFGARAHARWIYMSIRLHSACPPTPPIITSLCYYLLKQSHICFNLTEAIWRELDFMASYGRFTINLECGAET